MTFWGKIVQFVTHGLLTIREFDKQKRELVCCYKSTCIIYEFCCLLYCYHVSFLCAILFSFILLFPINPLHHIKCGCGQLYMRHIESPTHFMDCTFIQFKLLSWFLVTIIHIIMLIHDQEFAIQYRTSRQPPKGRMCKFLLNARDFIYPLWSVTKFSLFLIFLKTKFLQPSN